MKLNKTQIIVGVVGVLILIFVIYKLVQRGGESSTDVGYNPYKIHSGPCPGETRVFVQKDPYMRGVIEQGTKFKVIFNYYECNKIKDGDLVFYNFSNNMEPFVKIARAVPGDHIKLVKDKAHGAWNLVVNGDMVLNETDHKPYFFGGDMPPTISLYEKPTKGIMKGQDVILLGSWGPGDNDSGIYGVASLVDVLGKVEKIDSDSASEETEPKSTPVSKATPKAKEVVKSPAKSASPTPGPGVLKKADTKAVPKASPKPLPSPPKKNK